MKKILLPKSLDIEKIIFSSNNQYFNTTLNKFEKYNFYLSSLKIESIYYILYMIFYSTINKLNVKDQAERNNYVQNRNFIYNDVYIDLPSNELQKIDRDYNKILKFLCNSHLNHNNILFRSNYKNGKTFSYSFNYKYIISKFKILNISRKSILKSLYSSCTVSISGVTINRDLSSLKNDFLNKFKIDFETLPEEVLDDNMISGYSSIISLIDYDNGRKWMSLNDKTDGRLHTNFTILSTKYRSLITNNKGEQLIELDIGSCIPYLLTMSIIYRNKLKERIKSNDDLLNYLSLFEIIHQDIILNNCKDKLAYELNEVHGSIIEDRFYTDLISGNNLNKIDILSVFFCKNGTKKLAENRFKDLYPNIYYILRKLKDNKTWIDKFGYPPNNECNKLLSYYLFHLESNIILHKLIKEIKKINNRIEILTVHDCVIVSKRYVNEVKSIIEKVFKDIFNYKVNIKIKNI